MRYLRFKFITSGVVVMLMANAAWAAPVDGIDMLSRLTHYPSAELVESTSETDPAFHLINLGSLEKINHEIVPEQSVVINGRKFSGTYYLPRARSTKKVVSHYLTQLKDMGELVFQCRGRGCGSSSFWANEVFQRAIIYGPEQYQRYAVYQLNDDAGYLMAYVGERATREIYVHLELITEVKD